LISSFKKIRIFPKELTALGKGIGHITVLENFAAQSQISELRIHFVFLENRYWG
jgi:hypothetical protein